MVINGKKLDTESTEYLILILMYNLRFTKIYVKEVEKNCKTALRIGKRVT